MPIFDPEIASMWEVPVCRKSCLVSSSRPVVSPIVSALMMPVCFAPELSIFSARNLLHASTWLSPSATETIVPLNSCDTPSSLLSHFHDMRDGFLNVKDSSSKDPNTRTRSLMVILSWVVLRAMRRPRAYSGDVILIIFMFGDACTTRPSYVNASDDEFSGRWLERPGLSGPPLVLVSATGIWLPLRKASGRFCATLVILTMPDRTKQASIIIDAEREYPRRSRIGAVERSAIHTGIETMIGVE